MTTPDWRQTLRRASFRGAEFWVETEGASGSRRIKYHEFPHGDNYYAEDLGQGIDKFPQTAYVVGQQADSAARALIAACSAKGVGGLVLPMLGRLRATCPEWSMDRAKDKMGYVAFKIEFVRDKGGGTSLLPVPMLGRLAEVALGGLQAPLASAFSSAFQGVGVADFVTKSSAGLIGALGGQLESLRSAVPLGGLASVALKGQIGDLIKNAPDLASGGAIGDLVSSTSFIRQAVQVAHQLPVKVVDIMGGFLEAAVPEDAVVLFNGLSDFTSAALLNQLTPNRAIEFNNHRAIEKLVRRAALGHMAVAATRVKYDLRRNAVQARADIAEKFDLELAG